MDLQYHFDETGQPVAVEIDGDVQDLPPVEQAVTPGKTIQTVRDLSTTLRSTVESIEDSFDGDSILVDIEATHGGYSNKNNYFYDPDGMEKYVDTWTEPYGKPYLAESPHDLETGDPKGRVEDAEMVWTGPDTGFHALDVRVGDEEEIQRIVDGRALTVSVGSTPAETVECSICGKDLFHDGRGSKTFELEQAPPASWLNEDAPGVYGAFGKTNRDLWDYREDDDGNHVCRCRHIRGIEAPLGGDNFSEIDWRMHGNKYREVSRVNLPADQNQETGEFAHIRGVAEQNDNLDDEIQRRVMTSELSRVEDHSPVEYARHQIVPSKDDLYVPTSVDDALGVMGRADDEFLFDTGLWVALSGQNPQLSFDELLSDYVERGGRVISSDAGSSSSAAGAAAAEEGTSFEDAEYEVGGETITISPPDYMVSAAENALEAADEGAGSDCGTGTGTRRANQIIDDEVGPDVIDEIASYLTSHEEDVTAEGSTGEWTEEEWDDCGNLQYAKWGGDGSGRAMEWAQDKTNEVAEAKGEELPYEDSAAGSETTGLEATDYEDAKYSVGDKVKWSWQGSTVHGKVAEIGDQFTVSGNKITGDEGEAVYKLDEWDDDAEEFNEGNVAKPESSLSKSDKNMEASDAGQTLLDLSPREFGKELRGREDLTDEEKDSLDRMYVALNMGGMEVQDEHGDWSSAGDRDLATKGDTSTDWDGSQALDDLMARAEGEDGEIDASMVKRGVVAFDSSSDGQNEADYKGPFAVEDGGELKAHMGGIDALDSMASQMDVPQSVIDSAENLVDHYKDKAGESEEEESEDALTDDQLADRHSEILSLSPRAFGDALRSLEGLSGAEKDRLDRLYVERHMRGEKE